MRWNPLSAVIPDAMTFVEGHKRVLNKANPHGCRRAKCNPKPEELRCNSPQWICMSAVLSQVGADLIPGCHEALKTHVVRERKKEEIHMES